MGWDTGLALNPRSACFCFYSILQILLLVFCFVFWLLFVFCCFFCLAFVTRRDDHTPRDACAYCLLTWCFLCIQSPMWCQAVLSPGFSLCCSILEFCQKSPAQGFASVIWHLPFQNENNRYPASGFSKTTFFLKHQLGSFEIGLLLLCLKIMFTTLVIEQQDGSQIVILKGLYWHLLIQHKKNGIKCGNPLCRDLTTLCVNTICVFPLVENCEGLEWEKKKISLNLN